MPCPIPSGYRIVDVYNAVHETRYLVRSGNVEQILENPAELHWKCVKRVLRYLKETADYALHYNAVDSPDLVAYSDADWGSAFDRKSISGCSVFFGGALVSWASKKQSTIALSTTEAEMVAISEALRELLWLSNLCESFEVHNIDLKLYTDNQPALSIAHKPGFNGQTKHMDIKYLHIQDVLEKKLLTLEYCPTQKMVADIMTKSMPKNKHVEMCKLLRLRPMPSVRGSVGQKHLGHLEEDGQGHAPHMDAGSGQDSS